MLIGCYKSKIKLYLQYANIAWSTHKIYRTNKHKIYIQNQHFCEYMAFTMYRCVSSINIQILCNWVLVSTFSHSPPVINLYTHIIHAYVMLYYLINIRIVHTPGYMLVVHQHIYIFGWTRNTNISVAYSFAPALSQVLYKLNFPQNISYLR